MNAAHALPARCGEWIARVVSERPYAISKLLEEPGLYCHLTCGEMI